VQVNGTSACKRKHQEETEGSSEEGSNEGYSEEPDSTGRRVLALCLAHKTLHLRRLQ
ncbi:hypothetical protein M9458_040347, partial [Cirrhinus mrigala]